MADTAKRNKKNRLDGPFFPVDFELADASAIQALFKGTATGEQQIRAMIWITNRACGYREECYYPDRPNDTAYALGSRFVALQIFKLNSLIVSAFVKTENQ